MVDVVEGRNVNWTWPAALKLLDECGAQEDSRAGPVVAAPWPVVTVYERPTERVLLEPARDANPFFHLFEAIWMLAGRQDGAWLDTYVQDFSSRYAEADGTIHGAYGHRWRRHFDVDQLAVVVDRLRRDPRDRRAVIQMWDPVVDLVGPEAEPVVGHDGGVHERLVWPEEPRDVCCNTVIYPRVRDLAAGPVLDLTVSCRSNDVIWGLHGANAVHFSVMQEWLAAAVGARVGRMVTLSNNYHAYVVELERVRERGVKGGLCDQRGLPPDPREPYPGTEPMVTVPHEFLRDAERWCAAEDPTVGVYANSWYAHVAAPLWHAHRYWRGGDYAAATYELDDCMAPDWRLAAQRWLARRQERAEGRAGQ